MSGAAADTGGNSGWADAALSCQLLALDPAGLGGMVVRAGPGPHRDRVCAWLREQIPSDSPTVRVPLNVTDDMLIGGLSLVATLSAGRAVAQRGLLERANGGLLVLSMAERLEARVTSIVCSVIDRGELLLEREGLTAKTRCHLGVVALDEGVGEESAPVALQDRLAFHLDLTVLSASSPQCLIPRASDVEAARKLLSATTIATSVIEALCAAALALGIVSARAPILAAAVARAHAALCGRSHVDERDACAAARLVLGPRASQLPEAPDEATEGSEPEESSDAPQERDPAGGHDDADREPSSPEEGPDEGRAPPQLDDLVLQAAKSAIPSGLLDALAVGRSPRGRSRSAGQSGAMRASTERGRPAGTVQALPRGGERLNVVETLRAAAPWQRLRQRADSTGRPLARRRVEIRKSDFRVTHFQQRTETCVIFSVDASGSAALQRLAEAKGAVEQVLTDCYARRDQVALIAFRGASAVLLLPPTRSLARVRRSLADLAGGGRTPLASGIDAALALAFEARKRGRTPLLVLMTDGRANVATDGTANAGTANADALSSARAVRAAGVRVLFLDTSPRPRAQARSLATEMGARYLPLPYFDGLGISREIQSLARRES